MRIKPITVTLRTYGTKANIAALRKAAQALIDEEHGKAAPTCCVERVAGDVHGEIEAERWDRSVAIKAATPSQAGLVVTMPDMNERVTTEWLDEVKLARTCVCLASWFSEAEQVHCQLLFVDGMRWGDRRPAD